MEYLIGQRLNWTPVYFKWDVQCEVEVVKLYPRGFALLSNNFIADEDGIVLWHRRLAGKVEAVADSGVFCGVCASGVGAQPEEFLWRSAGPKPE